MKGDDSRGRQHVPISLKVVKQNVPPLLSEAKNKIVDMLSQQVGREQYTKWLSLLGVELT